MHHLSEAFNVLFGGNAPAKNLDALQMGGRAVLVYVAGLAVVRVGKNRLLGRSTAFDIVLGFILGSMLSRAINGAAPLMGTLVAAVVLVVLHWTFARLAITSDTVASAVKGRRVVLVRDGQIERAALRTADLSERDLREELRLGAHIDDPAEVALACLERNGHISVLPRRR